jgi:hypothetical protein
MIVFNLQCGDGHGFEAWFKDAKTYESQRRGRKVACPVCGDTKVGKVPTAPRIAKGVADGQTPMDQARSRSAQLMNALDQLHKRVEENCDYVGDRFAEEARSIHNGLAEERGIYGQATNEEAKQLTEEGVPFAAIPKRRPKDA